MKACYVLFAASLLLIMATAAGAATPVTAFDPAYVADGFWFENDMRDGGTATIPDLTGLGGDLETNQPLPMGAALLTTGFANNDKADVAVVNIYGLAASVFNTMELGYSYYKETVAGGNVFAAPSIKLAIVNQAGTGDNFGQLIYEPYTQVCCGAVTPDLWTSVAIDPNTGGGGVDGTGGWWWTGGFNIASSAGGPPYRSLAEWATAFAAADPADFPGAVVFQVAMGVGTFNQGQRGYFDDVTIANTLADACYDFDPDIPVAVEETTWGSIKKLYSVSE